MLNVPCLQQNVSSFQSTNCFSFLCRKLYRDGPKGGHRHQIFKVYSAYICFMCSFCSGNENMMLQNIDLHLMFSLMKMVIEWYIFDHILIVEFRYQQPVYQNFSQSCFVQFILHKLQIVHLKIHFWKVISYAPSLILSLEWAITVIFMRAKVFLMHISVKGTDTTKCNIFAYVQILPVCLNKSIVETIKPYILFNIHILFQIVYNGNELGQSSAHS